MRLLTPLLLALTAAGCLTDPESTQNVFPKTSLSDANLLGDPDAGTDDDAPAATPCGCYPAVGTWYRFTTLSVKELAAAVPLVAESLNQLWQKDINNFELNILFQIKGIQADGQMALEAYSGARDPGLGNDAEGEPVLGTCIVESTKFEFALPVNTCQYGPADKVELEVYAGTTSNPKNCVQGESFHVLPVTEVRLGTVHSGICDGTDADYLEGELVGSIAETLLRGLCTCTKDSSLDCDVPSAEYTSSTGNCGGCSKAFSPLYGLLLMLNDNKDITYDCKTVDGDSAACIKATFKAQPMAVSPSACPL
ncbi:MAG: hypothetical protein IV100_33045 [Myxococcales bacterium]|nr:hypothetical protein [Myxococcales bacterium]